MAPDTGLKYNEILVFDIKDYLNVEVKFILHDYEIFLYLLVSSKNLESLRGFLKFVY